MSAPAPPPASFTFEVGVKCNNCGTILTDLQAHTEEEAKQAFAKALTASELHDCKGGPKK